MTAPWFNLPLSLVCLSLSCAASISLPATPINGFVQQFYQAEEQSNSTWLAEHFLADNTTADRSLHSRLFTGSDTDGTPAGPTLFVTNSATPLVQSYQIENITQGNGLCEVIVLEHRATGLVLTRLELVHPHRLDHTWQISIYSYYNSTGKYDAFLLQ